MSEVSGGPSVRQPAQVDVTLKMWREGFTVNDGPMRNYADPDNKEFLDCIRKGYVEDCISSYLSCHFVRGVTASTIFAFPFQ